MEIKFNNVTYKDNKKVLFKNINISFKEKSISSFIGVKNSDFFYKLLIERNKLLDGEVIFSEKIDDFKIQMVSNNFNFVKSTIRRELEYVLDCYDYRQDDKEKYVKDALKMVDFDVLYIDRKINTLSDGEKKKLLLAKALILNPKVLVFDEPMMYLDGYNINNLIKIMRFLKNRYHKIIIIFSNDVDFIHMMSDYICVINKGMMVYSGDKYDVFKNTEMLDKYHIPCPKLITFSNLVLDKKKKRIGYRDDINDLLKDIYRFK